MKFKLDENLPVDLVRVLGGIGHDVDTVPQEALVVVTERKLRVMRPNELRVASIH